MSGPPRLQYCVYSCPILKAKGFARDEPKKKKEEKEQKQKHEKEESKKEVKPNVANAVVHAKVQTSFHLEIRQLQSPRLRLQASSLDPHLLLEPKRMPVSVRCLCCLFYAAQSFAENHGGGCPPRSLYDQSLLPRHPVFRHCCQRLPYPGQRERWICRGCRLWYGSNFSSPPRLELTGRSYEGHS